MKKFFTTSSVARAGDNCRCSSPDHDKKGLNLEDAKKVIAATVAEAK